MPGQTDDLRRDDTPALPRWARGLIWLLLVTLLHAASPIAPICEAALPSHQASAARGCCDHGAAPRLEDEEPAAPEPCCPEGRRCIQRCCGAQPWIAGSEGSVPLSPQRRWRRVHAALAPLVLTPTILLQPPRAL